MSTAKSIPVRQALAWTILALAANPVIAQVRPIAYPSGNQSGTWGYYVPLGEECTGNATRARTHVLFPAEYLPPRPGLISALEHVPSPLNVAPCTSGMTTVTYTMLEVRLTHRARGAGPLSTIFASNLPSPPPPPVFSGPTVIAWTSGNWSRLGFATPFAYNGVDDVVMEIIKVVQPTGQNVGTVRNVNPPRADLPRQVWAFGGPTSNADQAVAGNYADLLGWRLCFDGTPLPTLDVRSPLSNSVHFMNGSPTGPCHFRIYAPQGDLYVVAYSLAPFLPSSIAVTPAVQGIWLDVLQPSTVLLPLGVSQPAPGADHTRLDFWLPFGSQFVGLHVRCQAATLGPTVVASTNAVDFVIQ